MSKRVKMMMALVAVMMTGSAVAQAGQASTVIQPRIVLGGGHDRDEPRPSKVVKVVRRDDDCDRGRYRHVRWKEYKKVYISHGHSRGRWQRGYD